MPSSEMIMINSIYMNWKKFFFFHDLQGSLIFLILDAASHVLPWHWVNSNLKNLLLFKISNYQILFSLIINRQVIFGFFVLLHFRELCIWIVGLTNLSVGLLYEWHLPLDFKVPYVSFSSCLSLEIKRRPFSFSELPNAKASNPRFKSFFNRP